MHRIRFFFLFVVVVVCLSVASDVVASEQNALVGNKCDTWDGQSCSFPTVSYVKNIVYNGFYPDTSNLFDQSPTSTFNANTVSSTQFPRWWLFLDGTGNNKYVSLNGGVNGTGQPDLGLPYSTSTYQTRVISVGVSSIGISSGEPQYFTSVTDAQYSRTGYASSSTNAITFNVHLYADTALGNIVTSSDYWGLEIYGDGITTFNQNVGCVAIGIMDLNVTVSLPPGNYQGVGFGGTNNAGCSSWGDSGAIEPEPYTGNTVFTVFPGSFETTIISEYFINTTEIVSTISAKNPTTVSFGVSKRPEIVIDAQSESINNTVSGTGTVSSVFGSLSDGTYDLLVKFSNIGCSVGLSSCPFPLSYVYTYFVINGGVVTTVGQNEIFNNTVVPPFILQYEDCGLSNLSGCVNNSFRFLFVPDSVLITQITQSNAVLFSEKIPFVYLGDIKQFANEVFNSPLNQSIDLVFDLPFGEITVLNQDILSSAPYVSLIKSLISALLYIAFAMAMYRIARNIFNPHQS